MTMLRRLTIPGVILGAVFVGLFTVTLQATGGWSIETGWSRESLYDVSAYVLLAILGGAGLLLAMDDVTARLAGAAAAAVSGLALAGAGATAHRRWFTSGGFTNSAKNEHDLRLMAASMVAAGLIACAAGLSVLWRAGHLRLNAIGIGIAVLVGAGVPMVFGYEANNLATGLGAHGLMYGLPWALGALIVSCDQGAARRAAAAVVAIHLGALALDQGPMIEIPRRLTGIAVAAALIAVAWFARRREVAAINDSMLSFSEP
jgi:hypothetical protein